MTTRSDQRPSARSAFGQFTARAAFPAFVAGVVVTLGISALASNSGIISLHDHGVLSTDMTSAERAAHVDKLLKHFYIDVDATDLRKQKIDPIVKQAAKDLMPLHAQFHSAHQEIHSLLTQEVIDRAALETLRASQMQIADRASKRITQLSVDAGDVLTPAQRKKLVELIAQHAGMRHG